MLSSRLFASAVLSLALVSMNAPARADVCVGPAYGPPFLPGPPHWTAAPPDTHTELNDPRWIGASRRSFSFASQAGGSETAEVTFRGLSNGTDLYLSFQTLVDSSGATPGSTNISDAIYVGFAPQDNSAPARLVRFAVRTSADGDAQIWDPASTAILEATTYTRAADGTGSWANGPANASTYIPDAALWVDTATNTWAINLRVDTAALGFASGVKMFYGFNVQFTTSPPPGHFLQYSFPQVAGTWNSTAAANLNPINPGVWENLVMGGACTGGVALSMTNIGTTNSPASQIDTSGPNTFFANPTFPATGPNANLPAGSIEATFRIANWGAQYDGATWDKFGSGTSAAVIGGVGGGITYNCVQAAGPTQCPQLGANDHQCMLVELEGTGGTPVDFSVDSAYRNMDFVNNSELERIAEINIAGLPDVPSGLRDIYVYVKTVNMPAPGEKEIKLPFDAMRNALAMVGHAQPQPPSDKDKPKTHDLRAAAAPAAAATNPDAPKGGPQPTAGKSVYEELSDVWPTYEVHAYYETGETIADGTVVHNRLKPLVPFGYFVAHKGPLYGFAHAFDAVDGTLIEELAPNFYRLSIPNGGKAKVVTKIVSIDKPESSKTDSAQVCHHKHGCHCGIVGAQGTDARLAWLGVLSALALVIARTRRRAARS